MGRASRERKRKSEEAKAPVTPVDPGANIPWKYVGLAVAVAGAAAAAFILARGSGAAGDRSDRPAAPPPASVDIAEAEPNDGTDSAQAVTGSPLLIKAELGAGDRDFYSITLEPGPPHLVDVTISGSAGMRIWLSRDGDDAKVSGAVGAPLLGVGLAPGRVFVVVDGGEAGATGSYELALSRQRWRLGNEFEPNDDGDSAGQMARLPLPSSPAKEVDKRLPARTVNLMSVRGRWAHAGDVDCFAVPLEVPPTGAVMRVELVPAGKASAELSILDENHKLLVKMAAVAVGAAVVVPAVGARSWEAAYAVCARATSDEWRAGQSYRLQVETLAPRDAIEFEPNDDQATASALPRGLAMAGYLSAGDVDWLRISTGPAARLQATVVAPEGVECELVLVDGQGAELGSVRAAAGKEARLAGDRPTWVRLRAISGGNVIDRYEVRVQAEEAKP